MVDTKFSPLSDRLPVVPVKARVERIERGGTRYVSGTSLPRLILIPFYRLVNFS